MNLKQYMCVCVRACLRVCVLCVRVHACVHACIHVCVAACLYVSAFMFYFRLLKTSNILLWSALAHGGRKVRLHIFDDVGAAAAE